MAAISFADDLVRDYLLFRGFVNALKAFDTEIKADKDKGFRADKIVEHLTTCIINLDLIGLRETWAHLDQRIFCRLEHSFSSAARKLETALFRMYVVTCIKENRADKLNDFFEKMMPELHALPEWKDWFALPFLKSVEENPTFHMYFTRQWQDTMLLSLQNFLSVVFQSMAMPTILSYEDELLHLSALKEENEALKLKLAQNGITDFDKGDQRNFLGHNELMDDFYVIAQETPVAETQSRSLRSLIRNIGSGLPTSPLLGRRQANGTTTTRRHTVDDSAISKPTSAVKPKIRVPSHHNTGPSTSSSASSLVNVARVRPQMDSESGGNRARVSQQTTQLSSSAERRRAVTTTTANTSSSPIVSGANANTTDTATAEEQKGPLLLLSQEEFSEHQACITHCKFNCSGTIAASSDMEGVIKIWSPSPVPQTITSVVSRSSILSLEWASKREKLLLHGNMSGHIRFYDVKDKKTVGDIGFDTNSPLKDQHIRCIVCNHSDSHFVCSTITPVKPNSTPTTASGKLLLFDLRNQQLDRSLPPESSPVITNCCAFNHNGQLLVTGTSDGNVMLYDLRTCNCIATWNAHNGETFSVQFSADETSCFSMGSDGKFIQWNINMTGQKMSELRIHVGATGPFTVSGQAPSYRYNPLGKTFVFDTNGHNVLTCGSTGGIIYKYSQTENVKPMLSLGGHRWPVVSVDWSTTVDCGTCLTGSSDGKIQISTLLAQ